MADFHQAKKTDKSAIKDPYAGTGARPKEYKVRNEPQSDSNPFKNPLKKKKKNKETLKQASNTDKMTNDIFKKPLNPARNYSKKDDDMDSYSTTMLFAEELVDYVLRKLGYEWPVTVGARKLPETMVRRIFCDCVGDAVLDIIANDIDTILCSYQKLEESKRTSLEDYRREASISAALYFTTGYEHVKFLLFAANLVGLSALYMEKGNTRIADGSAQMLAYILDFYTSRLNFFPDTDWFTMCTTAMKIRNIVRETEQKFSFF